MKRGEITVFLALILSVMLSIVVGTIEAVRENTIRFQIECAMDIGLYSALAEYNRELLNQYDLFFIDTSYGNKTGNLAYTESHIQEFMAYNLQPQKDIIIPKYKDFFGLDIQKVSLLQASLATDNRCEVLKSQAIAYMTDKFGGNILEELLGEIDILQEFDLQEDMTGQREEVQGKIDSYNHTQVEVSKDEWKEVEIDNPADVVNRQRGSGVLYEVTQDNAALSGQSIHIKNYVSGRELREGNGLAPELASPTGMGKELLFGEYILMKLGNYTQTLSKSHLKYQVEYVLAGKESDLLNLRYTVNRLLVMRETANYTYLLRDGAKQAEAAALASGVSAVLLIPELKELIKQAILFAWAYAESVNDVKILLEKGKVPLMKSKKDWRMSLADLPNYKECLDSGESGSNGLSYQEYLRLLLAFVKQEEKAMRVADIIEMDIRKTQGNGNFCLDFCLDSMEVEALIRSSYGYEYFIKRRAGYEMFS